MATRKFYTVTEASEVLEVSQRRLLEMLETRELEAERDSHSSRWKIPKQAVHELVPERVPTDPSSGDPPEGSLRQPQETVEELIAELGNLQRELGRLRNRLELARQAGETAWQEERELLLIELEREREQAEDTLRAERERTEELRRERDSLEEELNTERSKGSLRKLLGG